MKKPKPLAWSYSRLKTYEGCPRQFKFAYVDKVPQPPSPAMARGTEIHGHLEKYIEGDLPRLPTELAKSLGELKREIARLRKSPSARAEVEVAVDKRWRPVDWFDRHAWLRAKFDVREPVAHPENATLGSLVIDHKTGRERPSEHGDQLSLYAVLEFSVDKQIDYVKAEIFYVDHGRKMGALYQDRRTALGRLRDQWEKRAERLLVDRKFEPTPGPSCRWCAFSQTKGGPCDAG